MKELKKEVFWCICFSRLLYEQKTMISSHVSTTNACSWTTQIFKLCPFFKTYLIFLFPVNLWDLFAFVFVFICACLEPTENPIGSWKWKYQFLVAEPSFLPLTFCFNFLLSFVFNFWEYNWITIFLFCPTLFQSHTYDSTLSFKSIASSCCCCFVLLRDIAMYLWTIVNAHTSHNVCSSLGKPLLPFSRRPPLSSLNKVSDMFRIFIQF